MNRVMKVTLFVDFDKLMKNNNVNVDDNYLSEAEENVVKKFIGKIMEEKTIVASEFELEDLYKNVTLSYSKSRKMGCSVSHIYGKRPYGKCISSEELSQKQKTTPTGEQNG